MFEGRRHKRRECEQHNSDGRVRGGQSKKTKTAERPGTEEVNGVVGQKRSVDKRGWWTKEEEGGGCRRGGGGRRGGLGATWRG